MQYCNTATYLALGVQFFATNMSAFGVFDDPYKAGLKKVLRALGEPLREACERQGLCAELGGLKLPPHELVVADQASCAKAGVKHVLRSDMDGVVPRPQAWARDFDGADLALQLRRERVFIHVLVLMAKALNEDFHAAMREVLGPHVVAGEGVMARNKDGSWRLTQQKGYARMLWCVHVACRSPSFATTCLLLLAHHHRPTRCRFPLRAPQQALYRPPHRARLPPRPEHRRAAHHRRVRDAGAAEGRRRGARRVLPRLRPHQGARGGDAARRRPLPRERARARLPARSLARSPRPLALARAALPFAPSRTTLPFGTHRSCTSSGR